MRSLFTLSSTQKATIAPPLKSPKKKASAKDYPTVSQFSSTRTQKSSDFNDDNGSSRSNSRSKTSPVKQNNPSVQDNQGNVEKEQTIKKQETSKQKTTKKSNRESFEQQYNELAQKYFEALQLKEYLVEEKQLTEEAIEILYSNQIKLEKGVIPTSMKEELEANEEENENENSDSIQENEEKSTQEENQNTE